MPAWYTLGHRSRIWAIVSRLPRLLDKTSWVTRTGSHNTLVIDSENQDARAEAVITHQEVGPEMSWVQIDLLARSNGGKLRQWTRQGWITCKGWPR